MTLRRLTVAMTVVCGLCAWGFARSSETAPPSADPVRVEGGAGGTRDDGVARFRTNQSRHWRHVAVGNQSSSH